ncbi:MAG: alpha/beta fold hydrolase [Steroidobacteraceae bacterium]
MRSLLVLALLVTSGYFSLCAWLYFSQRSQIYFQVPEVNPPGAQSIRLESGAATLKIWVVERPGPRALIYFGGNAEDVSVNLPAFAAAFQDHSLYLVNYRGYGGSTGSPTEAALIADAKAIFDHLRAQYPDIAVIGRSLGTGVAIQLAATRELRRLVLVTPFDSLANVAAAHFPLFPVALLMRDRYDSANRTHAIRCPVLAIIAGNDEIIPRARSEALVNSFPRSQIRVTRLDGAMHNAIDMYPGYHRAVANFLAAD